MKLISVTLSFAIIMAAGIASAQELTSELKSFEGTYQLIQGSAKVKGDFSKISQDPSAVCLPKFKLAQGEDYLELVDASSGQFVESFENVDKNTSFFPGVPASYTSSGGRSNITIQKSSDGMKMIFAALDDIGAPIAKVACAYTKVK